MQKEMIVTSNGHETQVAILEEDLVTEMFVERERQRGVVGFAVGDLQRRRRQRIDARKIGFRPQAKDLERHHDLKSSGIRRSAR